MALVIKAADQSKPRKAEAADDGRLRVGLDAPGLSPDNVDPLMAIDLVRAYLDLLAALGMEEDKAFSFRGMQVEAGSVALAVRPSERGRARTVVARARRMLEGKETVLQRHESLVAEVKRKVRALPPDHVAYSSFGRSKFQLLPREAEVWRPPESITTFRATLIQVGGLRQPHARFVSRLENDGEPFALRVTEDEAKRLAVDLYQEMEISAQVQWNAEGKIESGSLLEAETVGEDADQFERLREWFQKAAPGWDAVEDVERELGRGD